MLIKEILIQRILDNDTGTKDADFAEMNLDDSDISRLATGIKTNTHLESLSLFESNVRQEHLKPLYDAIMENKHLKNLQIQKFLNYSKLSINLIDLMYDHVKTNNHAVSMRMK